MPAKPSDDAAPQLSVRVLASLLRLFPRRAGEHECEFVHLVRIHLLKCARTYARNHLLVRPKPSILQLNYRQLQAIGEKFEL